MGVSHDSVQQQLQHLGISVPWYYSGELAILSGALMQDEHIHALLPGRYESSLAMLVATNKRLLFVDKKPFTAIVEDIPYDTILEVDHGMRLIEGRLTVHTRSRTLLMHNWNAKRITGFAAYLKAHIVHLREHLHFAHMDMSVNTATPKQRPERLSGGFLPGVQRVDIG